MVLVLDQTLMIVSSPHGMVFGRVGVAAPDVEHRLAVDVDRDRGAHLCTAAEFLGQRVGDLVESGVRMAVHGVGHAVETTRRRVERSPVVVAAFGSQHALQPGAVDLGQLVADDFALGLDVVVHAVGHRGEHVRCACSR